MKYEVSVLFVRYSASACSYTYGHALTRHDALPISGRVVSAHRGRSAARTSRGGASRKQLIAQTFRHRCSRESGSPESLRTALVVLGSRFRGNTWHPSDIAHLLLLPRRAVHRTLRTIGRHQV